MECCAFREVSARRSQQPRTCGSLRCLSAAFGVTPFKTLANTLTVSILTRLTFSSSFTTLLENLVGEETEYCQLYLIIFCLGSTPTTCELPRNPENSPFVIWVIPDFRGFAPVYFFSIVIADFRETPETPCESEQCTHLERYMFIPSMGDHQRCCC